MRALGAHGGVDQRGAEVDEERKGMGSYSVYVCMCVFEASAGCWISRVLRGRG